jgi:hypothetical protein
MRERIRWTTTTTFVPVENNYVAVTFTRKRWMMDCWRGSKASAYQMCSLQAQRANVDLETVAVEVSTSKNKGKIKWVWKLFEQKLGTVEANPATIRECTNED